MRTLGVEIGSCELAKHASQVVRAENDDNVIQAFSAKSPKKLFTYRIQPGRAWRDLHDFDSGAFSDSVECRTVLGVTIPNQQLWSTAEWGDLVQLLRRPLLGGCASYAYVHNLLRVHVDDEEREDWSEPYVVKLK